MQMLKLSPVQKGLIRVLGESDQAPIGHRSNVRKTDQFIGHLISAGSDNVAWGLRTLIKILAVCPIIFIVNRDYHKLLNAFERQVTAGLATRLVAMCPSPL